MKTAIIKTDFWKEDEVFKLLPDVRLFYMCLLTNPERNTTRVFKCSDRLMSAYTGYNIDTIKMCKDVLIKEGFIKIINDFYILSEQQCIEPKRGNLTKEIESEFLSSLPLKVQEELMSSTSAPLDYNNINNNINVNINNNNNLITTKENNKLEEEKASIQYQLAEMLARLISNNLAEKNRPHKEFKEKIITNWSKDIEKIHRIDGWDYETIGAVINWCQKDDFWKTNILSGATLRKQFKRLYLKGKSEFEQIKGQVVIV